MENRPCPVVGVYAVAFLGREYLRLGFALQKHNLSVLEIVSFPTLAFNTCSLYFFLLLHLCWETTLAEAILEPEAKCKITPPPLVYVLIETQVGGEKIELVPV